MSDFSDRPKSQEAPKQPNEETTKADQKETIPSQVDSSGEPTIDTPSENEEESSSIPKEVPPGEAGPDVESISSDAPVSDPIPLGETDSPTATEYDSEKVEQPPVETSDKKDTDTSKDTDASDDLAEPTPEQKDDDSEDTLETSASKDETNEEIITAAAASKVSSRFGSRNVGVGTTEEKVEDASPQQEPVEDVTPDTSSKKKKEKKPKQPLPDVAPESKIFNSLSILPWIPLIILTVVQGGLALCFRDLWPLQETQAAAVVKDTLAASHWLTPVLDGKPYSSAMPFYFWFASLISLIPDIVLSFAIKLSTLISSVLFVLSTYLFARAAGVSKKTSLASGMLVLAAILPAIAMQVSGMETLFASLVTFAHASFVVSWKRKRSFFWMTLGFLSAAAATLTCGFLGLFLPLLSILFLTFWRKQPTRFGEWDVAGGFGIYLVAVFGWFTYVYFAVQPEYLLNLIPNILAAPFKNVPAHLPYWWHMLTMLPFVVLPWIVILIVLPWTKLFTPSFYKSIWSTRDPEKIGTAYLWVSAVITCTLYCILDYMMPVWLLLLLPQFAILAAKALKNFSPFRSRIFYRLNAAIYLALGIALIVLINFTEFIPFEIQGWMFLSAVLIAAAGILWFKAPLNSRLGTILLAVIVTVFMQPLFFISAPTINNFISTEELSVSMENFAQKGYTPVVYNADPAPFAYFVNEQVTHVFDLHTLTTILDTGDNIVLIMSVTDWDNWLTKPDSLEVVTTQKPVISHLGNGYIMAVQQSMFNSTMPVPAPPKEALPESSPAEPLEKEPTQPAPKTEVEPAPEKKTAPQQANPFLKFGEALPVEGADEEPSAVTPIAEKVTDADSEAVFPMRNPKEATQGTATGTPEKASQPE